MVTKESVFEALESVHDPELHMSIAELGLIYDVEVTAGEKGSKVRVAMTLTTPACPYGPALMAMANSAVENLEGVEEAKIDLTFDPPWDPRTMASEEVRWRLGLM